MVVITRWLLLYLWVIQTGLQITKGTKDNLLNRFPGVQIPWNI